MNDLLYNNETDSGVGNTSMTAIRTTVLPLNERNLVNNEHIHIEDYLEETEVNKKA